MPTDEAADDVGGGVVGEHREDDGEDQQAPVVRDVPDRNEVREPATDPHHAQRPSPRTRSSPTAARRRSERRRTTIAIVERRPASSQVSSPSCVPEKRQREARRSPQHDGSQRPGHGVELVKREEAADDRERGEPPAAEVDEPEDERQKRGGDQDAGPRAGSSSAEPSTARSELRHRCLEIGASRSRATGCR